MIRGTDPAQARAGRKNVAAAGFTNVDLLQGTIEQLPLPDASWTGDLQLCGSTVARKGRVFAELFLVLSPRPAPRLGHVRRGMRLGEERREAYGRASPARSPVQAYLDA